MEGEDRTGGGGDLAGVAAGSFHISFCEEETLWEEERGPGSLSVWDSHPAGCHWFPQITSLTF